jgi:hypothetical protein
MTGRLVKPALSLVLSLVVAACSQGQSNPAGPGASSGPSGVPSGSFTPPPSASPKGFSGTLTFDDEWQAGPADGFISPTWTKQHLTVHVRLVPRVGSDGVTGRFDDGGSTYAYEGSGLYQDGPQGCVRVDNRTSTGSGSFGSTDRQISLFVDPVHGDLLGVDVAFTLTEKNASCDGLVTNGSADDAWFPSCGDAVADAAGHGRLLGIPKASDGSIDFTCSGSTIHQGVGSGTITVSGSLTRL